jgi:hypothetical protein
MLVAVDQGGRRRVASADLRGSEVLCPHCGVHLVVRIPARRVPHFAHPPGRMCVAAPAARRAVAKASKMRTRAADLAAELEAAGQSALFPPDSRVC